MPSTVTDKQLQQAVLQSVQDGAYPDSEAVISAELPSSALPGLLARFKQARERFKVEIREISTDTAPDIDGWIAQAKQLHNDLEKSRATARRIVEQSQEGVPAQEQIHDASNKVDLLKSEIVFNETLAGTLEHVRRIHEQLTLVQDATLGDQIIQAVDLLAVASQDMRCLGGFESTRVVGVLRHRADDLRNAIVRVLDECWDALITCHQSEQYIRIKSEVQRSSLITSEDVIRSMDKLGILKAKVDGLCKSLNEIILIPRLVFSSENTLALIKIDDKTIQVSGRLADCTIQDTFDDILLVVKYLSTHLPSEIGVSLLDILLPGLTSRLVSTWLADAVPSTLEGIDEYQEVLALVQTFIKDIHQLGRVGGNQLTDWVERAPQIWLTKRKETTLTRVRNVLSNGLGATHAVEREETQAVSRGDGVFSHDGGEDDWDVGWSDEEEETKNQEPHEDKVEEEDVSAWGLDDDTDDKPSSTRRTEAETAGDDEDVDQAWGWGDDDGATPSNTHDTVAKEGPALKSNGANLEPPNKVRQITLKETYTVTAVPRAILDLVFQIVSDAESLADISHKRSPVSPAATGLFTLPTLILAMYRATAESSYGKDTGGNMYRYNDSMWLAENLRTFSEEHGVKAGSNNPKAVGKLNSEADIKALEAFAKRAYGKEMEAQRTVLGDLLDGAQGFANCTIHPFAAECDTAVSSTVDRIRELNAQWKEVLSRSALLQSLGSLLSTVINKIIFDVEDMSDISEPESQRLTAFCNSISNLEDLFLPERAPGSSEDAMPLTAVYAPNWLKFQYLSNILESSLADIKYLWSEGELRLEFGAEELTDLIEALFADSEHRRRAIGEIRRSSMGR
ncbi:MAG: hypothetical protein M1812_000541 [Candelaria pacifica]|nr:MAG: hypothetical protein M1812_000541 [Candelaria pacifica]